MNKKGVVSISTFSLIIFILISLFVVVYYFYDNFKIDIEILKKEEELSNSINSLRSEILNLVLVNDSYLEYNNDIENDDIFFNISSSLMYASIYYKDIKIKKNFDLYGIKFCSNYVFSSKTYTDFYYNGNCISIIY